MQTYEYILISLSIGQFLAMIIGGYLFLSRPSTRANDRIDIIEERLNTVCPLKHKVIDENYLEIKQGFASLNKELQLFKENGLDHIEEHIGGINKKMAKMEGQNEMMIELFKDFLKKQ